MTKDNFVFPQIFFIFLSFTEKRTRTLIQEGDAHVYWINCPTRKKERKRKKAKGADDAPCKLN